MVWKTVCKGMKILLRGGVSTFYENCGKKSVFYNTKCTFVAGLNCIHERYPNRGIRKLLESKTNILPSFGEAQRQFSQFSLKMIGSNGAPQSAAQNDCSWIITVCTQLNMTTHSKSWQYDRTHSKSSTLNNVSPTWQITFDQKQEKKRVPKFHAQQSSQKRCFRRGAR